MLTSGAFDGLHAGHVGYLEAAKALCAADELLVCAVAPDQYLADVKGRPAGWPQRERMRTVLALGMVDAVLQQTNGSVARLITEHRPRLFVKGNDWQGRLPEDVWLACTAVGTAVAFVESPGTHSSEGLSVQRGDEAALAHFEALVHAQRPATAPWTPVTDYSYETRRVVEGPHATKLIDVFQPRSVCDAGCGPEAIFLRLIREAAGTTRPIVLGGFDLYECLTREIGVWQGDLCGDPHEVGRYELVVCREVLEHLTVKDVALAVRNLCRLSDRFVYVTTRFARAPAHLLSVDTSDDLDPTHITMMTQPFLRTLFVLEGFKRRADLEAKMDWKHLGRVLVYER